MYDYGKVGLRNMCKVWLKILRLKLKLRIKLTVNLKLFTVNKIRVIYNMSLIIISY
jgi:hypothetical protein